MRPSTFYLICLLLLLSSPVMAREQLNEPVLNAENLISYTTKEIKSIKEPHWRNNAYRDLAKSMAFHGDIDMAISLIDDINNSDTQAMTIRAIGMVLAIHKDFTDEKNRDIFSKLAIASEKVKDEGARDIAYTYIAMAQAFAGLDTDATKTTEAMKNPALKHKAFGETAEIQAERGHYDAAINSINLIDSLAFKNKSLGLVADIFVKRGELNRALDAAMQISNPVKKATALQKIINAKIGLNKVE